MAVDPIESPSPSNAWAIHPRSGIATLTYVAEGAVSYIDPENLRGTLPAGGVERMQAGSGVEPDSKTMLDELHGRAVAPTVARAATQ